MIPSQAAVRALQLHADGWTLSAIARHLGHDRKTVRLYLAGRRDPGQPRTGTIDAFSQFGSYATERLRQDPHLSAAGLHRELLTLDYTVSYSSLTRSLRLRGLPTECTACRDDVLPAFTQRPSLLHDLHPRQHLPIRVPPIAGQTIASFLDQVAAGNHLPVAVVLAHLPTRFGYQYRTHDDLAPGRLPPPERCDVEALAELTGIPPDTLSQALPALTTRHPDPTVPMRLTSACRRCTARRGLRAPIPVHLPALQRLCTRHRIWLGHTRQIDITSLGPDIVAATRRSLRLALRHGPARVVLAETIARVAVRRHLTHGSTHARAQRGATGIDLPASLHDDEDLFAAVTYSDVITIAAALLAVKDRAAWATMADTLVPRPDGSVRMAIPPSDRAPESLSMTNDHKIACHSI